LSRELNTIGVACDASSSCTLPTTMAAGLPLLDGATAATLASATANGQGRGVVDISAPNFPSQSGNVSLAVPGKAFGGAYSSNLTISVVTGP
jgi:hypothetical protein